MMKLLFFLTLILSTPLLHAKADVTGNLLKEGKYSYLVNNEGCIRFLITSVNADTTETIQRLHTGDEIKASGSLDTETCEFIITSINFVGLKSLLGYWTSDKGGFYSIRNFNTLEFYPNEEVSADTDSERYYEPVSPILYHYSVLPAHGQDWVIFLSDNVDTQFATIRLNKKRATLKIYDSETGDITQQQHLSKWGSIK